MRRLQFGSGPNKLPAPWENFDVETDISKPLPFETGSARYILAEHVIEHVTFRQGLAFLQSCWRVLEPGGVLRLSFPDITREIPLEEYKSLLYSHGAKNIHSQEDIWLAVLTNWGHQACWSKAAAMRILLAVGFEKVAAEMYGRSSHSHLNLIDGHHLSVGWDLARAETTVLEAIR